MNKFKTVNGTTYHAKTQDSVIACLESARHGHYRVHLSYGYTDEDSAKDGVGCKEVGLDWLEEFMVTGYIERSCGPSKIPIIVHNSRSLGGPAILDDCIVRIRMAAGGRVLYQHPKYHSGAIEVLRKDEPVQLPDGRTLNFEVRRDGVEQAAFETAAKAWRYVRKLGLIPA